MGLLDSILNLAFVVGAGYLTIYYIVPKIQSGDWMPPDFSTPPAAAAEDTNITNDIADTASGEEPEKIDLQAAWRFFY